MKLPKAIKIILGTAIAAVAIFVYVVAPMVSTWGPKTQCLSNIKQVGTALLMYAEVHDGHLPSDRIWHPVALPYLRSSDVLNCPLDHPPATFSLEYRLLGSNMDHPMKSELTLLFETPGHQRNSTGRFEDVNFQPLHPKNDPTRRTQAFLDGSARFMDQAKWEAAQATQVKLLGSSSSAVSD